MHDLSSSENLFLRIIKKTQINKTNLPDFLIRRIFDLVDIDRYGEINHKEFESWITDDGGVIKKVTSPSKMFDMSDEDEDEQDQNDSKHQEKRHCTFYQNIIKI